uniref:glutathione transferase n=1 Tax=Phallusia mammillata TaxID=59560 RepID=A0A6F9DKU9_9ASCI|nr:glutathione S-transferase 1-like [Phallusia mammillata]
MIMLDFTTKMPTYKLCYFNSRGLAEMIRLIFAEANVEYEDHRLSDWVELKPKMPFNTVPVLYVDGLALGNSRAIMRYLSKEFGINKGTPFELAKIDSWFEYIMETATKLHPLYSEPDKEYKASVVAKVEKEFQGKLQKLEELVNTNGGPYVFGKVN